MKPTETKDSRGDITRTHPAFGQIKVARVSGTARLYGSDFAHRQYVEISLHESEEKWSTGGRWHYATREKASVMLTEAQWATFVSSFNQGSGVPCTWQHAHIEHKGPFPYYEPIEDVTADFRRDVDDSFKEALGFLEQAHKLGKEKKVHSSILNGIEMAMRNIKSNLPFYKKQFDEHMEDTVEKAKVEANAYINQAINSAGLDAIKGYLQVHPEGAILGNDAPERAEGPARPLPEQ